MLSFRALLLLTLFSVHLLASTAQNALAQNPPAVLISHAQLGKELTDLNVEAKNLHRNWTSIKENKARSFAEQAQINLALVRLSHAPPESLLGGKVSSPESARRLAVLRETLPALAARITGLIDAEDQITIERELLQEKLADVKQRLGEVEFSVALPDPTGSIAVLPMVPIAHLGLLKTRIEEIEAVLLSPVSASDSGIEVAQPQPSDLPKLEPGELIFSKPAPLEVAKPFNSTTAQGLTLKGLILETSSNQDVVTPQRGLVAFSGDFRGYGKVVIIEHDQDHHSVLSGMNKLSVKKGEWVRRGQILGYMGTSVSKETNLYFELRVRGIPVDPVPWLN
jgi:murein DD-endopeptidase MepM/ murein hydrolase activator NlpD